MREPDWPKRYPRNNGPGPGSTGCPLINTLTFLPDQIKLDFNRLKIFSSDLANRMGGSGFLEIFYGKSGPQNRNLSGLVQKLWHLYGLLP
jgi:hypothetical protein